MSMFCDYLGLCLLGDFMEGLPSNHLEKERLGMCSGGDIVGGDNPGMDEVPHCARVDEGGEGEGFLLYTDGNVE